MSEISLILILKHINKAEFLQPGLTQRRLMPRHRAKPLKFKNDKE